MKYRLIIFFINTYCLQLCFAQDSLITKKLNEQSVEFSGEGLLSSNIFSNNFLATFYQGKKINNDIKDLASRGIKDVNQLGGMSAVGLTYTYRSLEGLHKPIFSFSYFDRTHLDMKFSNDLFYLVFYGNKRFAGETARLGNFSVNYFRYQQFCFGWKWLGDKHHGSYGFAFSMLNGEKNLSINSSKANLFTAADGSYIDFLIDMKIQQTDNAHQKYFSQNGIGLSADLFYEMPFVFWNKLGLVRMDIKDLGFINWNSRSSNYDINSSLHFDGVSVNKLFALDSTVFSSKMDSLIKQSTVYTQKKYSSYIPGILDFHTKSFYGKRVLIEKGFIWRFNTVAKLYYYAKIHFLAGRKKSLDFAYVFGYGGYGLYNSGLEIRSDFKKNYSLHFISNYLFPGILSSSSLGVGLFIKVVRKI